MIIQTPVMTFSSLNKYYNQCVYHSIVALYKVYTGCVCLYLSYDYQLVFYKVSFQDPNCSIKTNML